jgi:hypothetical protein
MARRDEGAYLQYATEEQRSQPGWIGREGDRLSHSRALRDSPGQPSSGLAGPSLAPDRTHRRPRDRLIPSRALS